MSGKVEDIAKKGSCEGGEEGNGEETRAKLGGKKEEEEIYEEEKEVEGEEEEVEDGEEEVGEVEEE